MQASCFTAALQYRTHGLSVIPVAPRGKRPLIDWKEYQRRLPAEHEIREWWKKHPEANVAIVCGQVSGILVLDVDGPEAQEALRGRELPATPTAATGRGRHYYFACPAYPVPSHAALGGIKGIDIRGDGGCAVAPPSVHASGRRYHWIDGLGLFEAPLAPCPDWLLELIGPQPENRAPGRSPEEWRRLVSEGVEEGARNNAVASLAGHLLRRGVDPYVVLELALIWNRAKCRPPLDDEEVVATVNSIARREARRRGLIP